jgi:8-oxo-dGTP pyrophosphatase MutT (NUDIX family)
MKKKGLGAGKYNGFGGKVEPNESVEQGALRELREEADVTVDQMEKHAELTFVFPHKPEWNQIVHVFVADSCTGNPTESDEMRPEWFSADKLPYQNMWASDAHWLPPVLEGKFVTATFVWAPDGSILEKEVIVK